MIGILGGTFDPIHMGHMHVAEQVQSRVLLDEIHFLPCAIPVHRDTPRVSDANRVQMIELAIARNSRFRLNTLELDRGGQSYTVDTLRQIKAQNQTDTIILILGADAFNQFSGWKSPREILQLVHLVVCKRPGVELDKSIYADHWINSAQKLRGQTQSCILALEIDENPCSSTHVRKLLLEQNQADRCLAPAVYQFIVRNHLYEQSQ
jgi:nicotinate-nucleotide adenylyltransferase